MRVFKTRWFAKFARRERIADVTLVDAIEAAEQGLIDADLGGGLIKQRVARAGKGKSGGYRCIVGYREGDRAVCLFAFAKNARNNITSSELVNLQALARDVLGSSDEVIAEAVASERLKEIDYG